MNSPNSNYLIESEASDRPQESNYLIEPETPAEPQGDYLIEPEPQGMLSKAKDTAVSFGIGANSLLQMAGDFYGLATGDMGNVVSQQAKENIQYLQQRKSPELRQAEEARRKAIEADEDELGKALTYVRQTVTNPSLLSNALAEQVPNLMGIGGAGALAKAGAEKVLLKTAADQAAKRLAAKKAAQIGTGAAVGAGAAMQGTDVGADLYDEAVSALDKITDEQAMSIPEIASLMEEKEATLDEAKTAFALTLGREAFALGATVSAGAQMLPGGRTIERAFVGKQAGRRLAGAITGGLGEAASEAVEEGGSRVAANLLARQFEPDRPLAKGVGEAVGQATVVGGIPGAAFGAASSRPTTQPAPEGQTTAGKTGEAPASAATKSALAGAPEVALESSEGLTPEQFYAAVNIRQARLMGGEPDPEDIRIAGEVPLPKVQIDPEKANRAIEEAQSALQEWADSTANAPQNIRIIFDPELLHNGYGVQGYYSPDGSIAVNAAFVTPDRVASIARHEWAHQTLATPEGQQAFANFVQREIPQSELDALATRYRTQDRRKLLEEWIAENQEKAPGVIERIVARIREWLAGVGIVDLSDAEVADIMLRTLRQQAENQVQPDTSMGDGGAVPVDPNAEAYNSFIGQRTEPKMSLQRLPTAGDVVDANGNLKYTVPQKTLDVSHYSNIGGLTEIDPAFYGTGRGQHYHRMMKGINKSFFFVGNSKPRGSENVSGKGMTRYRTSIDSSRIYNMDKDPLSLWFAANPEKSEGMLKELGYDGFLARTDDNRTFVALFYPTNLETGELNRTVAPEKEPEIEIDEAALAKATAKYEREQARRLRRALSGKFSLTEQPKRISGVIGSPSVTDINYDRAKRNLTSANQARFKSQISEYAPEAEIFDAVGDWVDGSENSVAAIFQDRKSGDELQRLAAQVGLAGDQKAVLWWRTEPEGADAIHEMIWPKGVSMDEARQAMIDVGLENRTLIQTPEGVRGFVFDQGRKNLNKIEALNEHETQPSLESSPAAGDFLGSWTSRAEGRRAYRRVLGSTPQAEARARELRSGQVGGVGDSGQPETRFSLAQTKTPEFKAWFGDSQIVTPEGNPRVMYHGTFSRRYFLDKLARIIPGKPDPDFTVFKPGGRANAIFVSPSPAFASKFAADTEDLGKKSFYGVTPEELAQERPGARVYPVFVKAENPFDYQNPDHIRKLFGDEEYLELVPGSKNSDTSDIYGSVDYDGVTLRRFEVEDGNWDAIEDLSERIKNAGFDSFYVREQGVKNLGVFTSKQLASATGNVGAFGQRPVTAEEARRMGLTEEEAAKAQAEGDIRFSLTEQVAKGRDPVLAAEAQKLKRGETTPAKYARKVEQRMPLRPFEEVPEPATDEDILRGLANRMAGETLKRELKANPEDIEGQQVEARLDIPSYEDANVWTVTLHLPRERAGAAGKVLAYTPTAILRDVSFTVNETAAMNVAAGARKSSFATMDGTYVPATARSAYEQAVEAKESGDWVEIGMNPIRHSYFYDKADQRPVVSAEEVIQVGGLVLGRGVQYGEKSDRKFSLSEEPVEETDEEIETEDPNLVLSAEAERERPDLPPTSALNTLYAQKSSIPIPETGKRTNGQVAEQLRQAALKYWGRKLDSSNLNADEIERIVDNGVEEVIAGLKASNHAGNWYTTAIRKAMAIAAVLHPELSNDALAQKAGFKDAKAAEVGLSLAMAITSQNLNVEKNTEYANEQFRILKETGRFDPSKEYGSKMEAISGNLRLANTLLDKVGWEGAEEFLNREYTVKELNEIASQVLGEDVSIAGKVDDLVNGSAIFGPKIGGGFFQNLRANFNPVTVDLWMRRTWGRWTGDVLPEPLNAPRLARMLEGMREAGIQLPEQLRSIRTVLATKGRKVPTLTDKAAQRILSDPEKVNAVYDFAAEQDSRWNKMYSEVRQNITPEQAAAVRAGELSLEQLNRLQQKSIREKRDAWQNLEGRPSGSSKEGRDAQKKFFEEMDAKAGRTAKLTNKELSKYKPEWAKSSRVITTLLKPVDVPSDLDRRVIVDVVNRIRAELQNQGVNATNADIQAILWYPEKDIWAKLAGKKESKLKSSYDEEFLRVAEAQGLGSEARDAAGRVGD